MPTARTLAPAALLAALVLTACNQGRKADRDDEPNDPVAKAFAALKQPRKADPVRADAADPARPA
ncbi:MAG: hypothetical protein K2X82_04080, partial [Gemmataceae bacterium]|nr:hypothetical protein [Gemmataceae bacterium]